jgi:hypothetical protein
VGDAVPSDDYDSFGRPVPFTGRTAQRITEHNSMLELGAYPAWAPTPTPGSDLGDEIRLASAFL